MSDITTINTVIDSLFSDGLQTQATQARLIARGLESFALLLTDQRPNWPEETRTLDDPTRLKLFAVRQSLARLDGALQTIAAMGTPEA